MSITIYPEQKLLDEIKKKAKKDLRSVNKTILTILKKYFRRKNDK